MFHRVIILASLCFALCYAACPGDYTELYGYCYRVYTSSKNFAVAESQCVSEGGHLASVHDDPTDNALAARIPKAQIALLGLQCTSNNGTHGNCAWTDGTPYDFDGFNGGLPIMAYGQCVTISQNDGNWYSTACGAQQNSFVCKQPTRNTALTCGDYTPYKDGCIQVKTHSADFSTAEVNCQKDGGHLLSLHNDYDSVTVQSLLNVVVPNVAGVFFGLYYSGSINYDYTDNSTYNFVNFANYYPNINYGYCVQIIVQSNVGQARQWRNVPCDTSLPYVCVRPKIGQLPTTLRTTTSRPTTTAQTTYAPYKCPSVQLFNDYGTIYSPGFPASFPANSNCEYLLAGPTGSQVTVRFPYFNIDSGSILRIYDGISATTPIYTLSGSPAYRSYNSTGNVLKLVFQTSNVPSGFGWQAEFNSFNPVTTLRTTTALPTTSVQTTYASFTCPSTQLFNDYGTVYSPGFPVSFPANINCEYLLAGPTESMITVRFPYFNTDSGTVLRIYDGISETIPIYTLSGSPAYRSYNSTGNVLKLVFQTSNLPRGIGWQAEFNNFNPVTTLRTTTALPTTSVQATYAPFTCPGTQLFNDYGTVYSPGFPLAFPSNTKCEYLLAVPAGSQVTVRFPYFNTDSGSILRIYDGISETTPIYTLSGTPAYRSYNSTGNVLKLSFQTSNVPRGIGWQAEFNSFTPIVFTTPRPYPATTLRTTTRELPSSCPDPYPYIGMPITSANYPDPYDANSNCNIYIQNMFGKVKLVFNSIDTVKDVDVLTIYDGGSTADPILGTVSGHYGWQEISFKSTGSWMTINFNVRSKVVTGGGWYAQSFTSL